MLKINKHNLLYVNILMIGLAGWYNLHIAAAQSLESSEGASPLPYPIVDTEQSKCYDNNAEVSCPKTGTAFSGQDAQYSGNLPRYQDNGNGTITDLVTNLMWQQEPGVKMTFQQASAGASSLHLAGYSDWRLPTIKELYSLILFDGTDVSACPGGNCSATPFIDTRYFHFKYGDTNANERVIDSQFATSTKYVSTTMIGNETMFGVNFADGRIKGYGLMDPRSAGQKKFYVLYVRGNPNYGKNTFSENSNGTISDTATSLTWMKADSGKGMDWSEAITYCEALSTAGADDWRLPNAKELQSIVDYSRSPSTTNSAAIDPLFSVTKITNEGGMSDYPFYWSSTTHADLSGNGAFGAYVAFGRAMGKMIVIWMDVHGAGAQRSDPKSGNAASYANGHGPQGDAVRINNYVRCVRGGDVKAVREGIRKVIRPAVPIQSAGMQPGSTTGGASQGGQPGMAGGQPPQEAILACRSLKFNAVCQMNTPQGTLSGTCQQIQTQLACVPARPPN